MMDAQFHKDYFFCFIDWTSYAAASLETMETKLTQYVPPFSNICQMRT